MPCVPESTSGRGVSESEAWDTISGIAAGIDRIDAHLSRLEAIVGKLAATVDKLTAGQPAADGTDTVPRGGPGPGAVG
jgi:hypothetical protein